MSHPMRKIVWLGCGHEPGRPPWKLNNSCRMAGRLTGPQLLSILYGNTKGCVLLIFRLILAAKFHRTDSKGVTYGLRTDHLK